jgi:RluA family pseudouridine synthase
MTQSGKSLMIRILHQTPNWIAVEKPTGISIHNIEDSENLLTLLKKQMQDQIFFPVHRLDKETSGVQLLALNESTASEMAQSFQNRKVQKIYQGVIAGSIPPVGIWNAPLSDKAEGRQNPEGLAKDQKPCETRFKILKSSPYFSWLQFEILTGRQHQIRKHCALAGHALIGDPRYGNPKYNQKIARLYQFNRMALHCTKLVLESGEEISSLPTDFELLFKS